MNYISSFKKLSDFYKGSFDSAVHISEEASNAATAVPWAITGSIFVAGVLGWAINVSLAFCMGTDLEGILDNSIGQPMATIFFNSFGQRATLGIWAIVVIVQVRNYACEPILIVVIIDLYCILFLPVLHG